MTELQQRALQVAKRHLDKREATGKNDGPFVRSLKRWAAKGATWLDGQPWCVMFATWCIHEAARELGRPVSLPERASSSRLYQWYRKSGTLLKEPVPGCVAMLRRGHASGSDASGGSSHTHTFLVHAVTDGMVIGVDGNYRNAVGWSKRPVGSCDYGAIL